MILCVLVQFRIAYFILTWNVSCLSVCNLYHCVHLRRSVISAFCLLVIVRCFFFICPLSEQILKEKFKNMLSYILIFIAFFLWIHNSTFYNWYMEKYNNTNKSEALSPITYCSFLWQIWPWYQQCSFQMIELSDGVPIKHHVKIC